MSRSTLVGRIGAMVGLLGVSVPLLAGCGGGGGQAVACPQGSAGPLSAAVSDDGRLPTVSGVFARSATITPVRGGASGKFIVKVLSAGSGAVVGKDDVVGFDFVSQTWSGKVLADSFTGSHGVEVANLHTGTDSAPLAPVLAQATAGHTVGSRLLIVTPECRDTFNTVIDIVTATPYAGAAHGVSQPVSADLPSVTMGERTAAKFTITDAQRNPTKLGVGVLIKGSGPVVKPGQRLITQYTGALLKNGSVFGSSWANGGAANFVIGKGQVITGWDKGLVGQRVGSRVILSIPAAEAYGPRARQGIPPNSNLIFVVDILNAA